MIKINFLNSILNKNKDKNNIYTHTYIKSI